MNNPYPLQQSDDHTIKPTWGTLAWVLVLALFALPMDYWWPMGVELEGSWIQALNDAVISGRVFGKDFVFTYGPLGFWSTRNAEGINYLVYLLGDVLAMAGYVWLLLRVLPVSARWLPVMLGCSLLIRWANGSQFYFILFAAYAALLIARRPAPVAALLFAALYGVLLFYIKANYGIISLAVLLGLIVWLAIRSFRQALILLVASLFVFFLVWPWVHIYIPGYIRYGIELISGYAPAMGYAHQPGLGRHTVAAAMFLSTALLFFMGRRRSLGFFLLLGWSALVGYLLFRNAFTRSDGGHSRQLFTVWPFFFVLLAALLGQLHRWATWFIALATIIAAACIMPGNGANVKNLTWDDVKERIIPYNYFRTLFSTYQKQPQDNFLFTPAAKAIIGSGPVDVFPIDIGTVLINKISYRPRPVPQSYSVYTPVLDSINAAFFLGASAPPTILIRNWSIDDRYPFWDESRTMATLQLNYQPDSRTVIADTAVHGATDSFLILRRIQAPVQSPIFTPMLERTVCIGDTVLVPEGAGKPVYASFHVGLRPVAKWQSLIWPPPQVHITLLYDSGDLRYRIIPRLAEEGIMVSYVVISNTEMKDFFSGALTRLYPIRAFILHSDTALTNAKVSVRFHKFANYRSAI